MTPELVWIVPLLPLLGFVISGLLGRKLGKAVVSLVACGSMGVAFVLSLLLFLGYHGAPSRVLAYDWIQAGKLNVPVAFTVDPLSLTMLLVVTGVGFLIHVYSTSYMAHDPGYARFFAYLNLFVFFMLVLVLAENLAVMFVGWEGVGLCSYLLIGFWHEKPSAADAGLKAFLVNRVGDFGFMTAMLISVAIFGTLSFAGISAGADAAMGAHGSWALRAIGFALFLAATGKSAQIPLYIWLPDAMEGPTPVSALIHAATMVTSGIYMVARLNGLFALVPDVLYVVSIVGAATACLAATMGLTATDIKKVLAYSTVSQLGYMFVGLGVGSTVGGMFHLVTHAFFKACLFLGAGAVMHALGNETDLRKMGGLRRKTPILWATMAIATLAIVGFPGLAGFVSKDAILAAAWEQHAYVPFALGFLTIGLTAFYMFRLLLLTFHGQPRMDAHTLEHAHDAPPAMLAALVPLALLSVVGGLLNWPHALGGSERFRQFLLPLIVSHEGAHAEASAPSAASELLFSGALLVPAALGFLLAWAFYRRQSEAPAKLARTFAPLYRLFSQKWYVDELYGALVVGPVVSGSRFVWRWFDEVVIDGLVNLTGILCEVVGELLRAFHTGLTRNYALFMTLGVAGIVLWMVL